MMSRHITVALMEFLVAKGMSAEDILEAARIIEAETEALPASAYIVDDVASRRRAWDRKRKAEQRVSGGQSGGNPPDNTAPSLIDTQSNSKLSEGNLKPTPPPLKAPRPDTFERWYSGYPHKVGKGAAERAFERVRKSGQVTFAELQDGLANYIRTKPPDRAWCNPATWLTQHRWADQPDETDAKAGQSISAATADLKLFAAEVERQQERERSARPVLAISGGVLDGSPDEELHRRAAG